MSLSLKRLEPINVKDPRVCVTSKSAYAVLEGASQVSQKVYTTTSVSQSSLQFSCPPPSGNNFVDRRVYIHAPLRLTMTATSTGIGQTVINPNQDAPRAMGFMSGVDVVNCTINNFSVSNNVSDYLHALMKYNVDDEIKGRLYSTTPTYADQAQLYSYLYGANNNPLALYNTNGSESGNPNRGGFCNYTIVANPVSTAAAQVLTAQVDIIFFEEFWLLSPLYWGKDETHPFVHCNTIDFNITMLQQAANRFWSHMDNLSGVAITPVPLTITSSSYQFANQITGSPSFSYAQTLPSIQFTYFTPKETQVVPRDMISVYPYTEILRYPTDFTFSYAAGAVNRVSSNSIQLSTVPRRIYLYARQSNANYYASPTQSDVFLGIEAVNIQYFNRTGLLSSASKRQLYEIAVKNGCNQTWNQWSNELMYGPSYAFRFGGQGSILCIDPACDLGLDSLTAPGKIDHTTLQIDVTFSSSLGAIPSPPTNYTLYIVCCNEGVFNVGPGVGQASGQVGVLSSQDILDARSKPGISYHMVQSVNGGDFLTGIKDFFLEKVLPVIKQSKIASNLAELIPIAGKPIAKSLRNLGYGEGVLVDEGCGMMSGEGVMMGGAKMRGRKGGMRTRVAM
jgi:hypothetical protein